MVSAPPKPKMLRICMTPGCWHGGDWDDLETGNWYCGPCIAVLAVNRFSDAGKLDELGIAPFPRNRQ